MEEAGTGLWVVLAGRDQLARRAFRRLVEGALEIEFVVEVDDAGEVLSALEDGDADLVFLESGLAREGRLLERLRAVDPDLPVLVVGSAEAEVQAREAACGGASGYLVHDATTHELRSAVDSAVRGEGFYLHPRAAVVFRLRQTGSTRRREVSRPDDEIEEPPRRR